MKQTGIVICNYNKAEDCLNCIQSVLESSYQDFDLFVVDNASADSSVEKIRERFGQKLTLIENGENLGGSGGFNTGLRAIIRKGYEYAVCLDNDVLVDCNAIGALAEFLDNHPDTGMVGSIVYHMEEPDFVQQYGLNIDFENYIADTLYENHPEGSDIPEEMYCDTVATCSMMARVSVLEKIGIMPEDNFIYWDDMEWGWRCNLFGYKVAVTKKSQVLHRMGAKKVSENTFPTYYMWRNWINFFLRYVKDSDLEHFSYVMIKAVFQSVYECMYRGEHNVRESILYAYDDALHGVRGKAGEGKIFPADYTENMLKTAMDRLPKGESIAIYSYGIYEMKAKNLYEYLKLNRPDLSVSLYEKPEDSTEIFSFHFCDYIFNLSQKQQKDIENSLNDGYFKCVYVDSSMTPVLTEEDLLFVRNYGFAQQCFLYSNQPLFLNLANKIRKEGSQPAGLATITM